jgi:hypothetical protein
MNEHVDALSLAAGQEVDRRLLEVQNALEAKIVPRLSAPRRAQELIDLLPEAIRIGPHDFRIVRVSHFDSDHRYGALDFKAHELRLAPHASPTNLVDTVLHEALHGVWMFSGLVASEQIKEEPAVTAVASGLTALFRDNDWLAGWIDRGTR